MIRVGRKLSVTKEGIFTNFRCYCVGAHTSCGVHMCGGSTHHVGFTCDHIIYILQCVFDVMLAAYNEVLEVCIK